MYVYDIPFFANFPLFLSVVGGFLIFIIYIGKHQHKITVKWRIRKRPIRFFICSQRAIRSHFYWFGMVKGKHYIKGEITQFCYACLNLSSIYLYILVLIHTTSAVPHIGGKLSEWKLIFQCLSTGYVLETNKSNKREEWFREKCET